MKILVYGAGVLGCNLARNLFRAGKDVTLLARGNWAEEIRKNGLRIKDKFSPRTSVSRIPVVTELAPDDRYDVIFVVLRYTQLDSALDTLRTNRTKNIVFVGNNVRARALAAALPEKKLSYREEHVASLRCDGIVSAVWRLSRSQGQTLFSQKKVFVNGRLTENGSQTLKDGDTVSVRGFGKFIFRGEKNTTKKGRLVIGADLFV